MISGIIGFIIGINIGFVISSLLVATIMKNRGE
mgnify:CR=1 FL=1